jgi:hypothetical protein
VTQLINAADWRSVRWKGTVVQKMTLTAIVDQADNSNLEATSCGQLSHAKK